MFFLLSSALYLLILELYLEFFKPLSCKNNLCAFQIFIEFFSPSSYVANIAGWMVLNSILYDFCFSLPAPILQLWFWKCWEWEIQDPSRCRAAIWSEAQKFWKGESKRWSPKEIRGWRKKWECSLYDDNGILEWWCETGRPLLPEMMVTRWELLAEMILILPVSLCVAIFSALGWFPLAVQSSALPDLSWPCH